MTVQVYYDPPVAKVAVNALGTKRLTMQFDCAVAGVSCSVLMDSGAEEQFISEGFARRVGIKGHKRVTLTSDCKAGAGDKGVAEAVPKLLSAVQVKRALRTACDSFLVSIRSVDEGQPVDLSPSGSDSTAASGGLKPVREWIQDNIDVFPAQLPGGLPPERNFGHTIPQVEGSKPVFGPMYRLSPIPGDGQLLQALCQGLFQSGDGKC
ncbi:hypothetical protein WJX77_001359 [Trebouxia sp. C0004]